MRLSMVVSKDLAAFLHGLAAKYGISIDEVVSRAIVGMALIRAARQRGLMHLGFVSDPSKLDAELHGLLPEQPRIVMRG